MHNDWSLFRLVLIAQRRTLNSKSITIVYVLLISQLLTKFCWKSLPKLAFAVVFESNFCLTFVSLSFIFLRGYHCRKYESFPGYFETLQYIRFCNRFTALLNARKRYHILLIWLNGRLRLQSNYFVTLFLVLLSLNNFVYLVCRCHPNVFADWLLQSDCSVI